MLTVVIAAHRPSSFLEETLGLLAREPPDVVQTVVVVSGERSSPPTPGVVWLDGRGTSLSEARNLGMAAAKGELVAFLDDDAVPAPGWVRELITAFENPQVGAVCGRVLPRWSDERPAWLDAWLLARVAAAWGLHDRGPGRRTARFPKYGVGANMAVRRSVIRSLGPFRGNLGRQSGRLLSNEEIEYLRRVELEGHRIVYAGAACVEHFVPAARMTVSYLRDRAFWQGVSERERGDYGLRGLLWIRIGRLGRWLVAVGWRCVRWRPSSRVFLQVATAAVRGLLSGRRSA